MSNQIQIQKNEADYIKGYEEGMIEGYQEGEKQRKKKDLNLVDGMPKMIEKKFLMEEMEGL